MSRFKMFGGGLKTNIGIGVGVFLAVALAITLGVIGGVFHWFQKGPPAPTTNTLNITLGSPSPQGCGGGGRISLGCEPTSLTVSVSLQNARPANSSSSGSTEFINNFVHWEVEGVAKDGVYYNNSGSQRFIADNAIISLATASGVAFKSMKGTVYLTDQNNGVGNSATFSYP